MDRLDLSPPSLPVHPVAAGAEDVAPLSVVRPGKIFRPQEPEIRHSPALPYARARMQQLSWTAVGPLSVALFGGYATGSAIMLLLWHLI